MSNEIRNFESMVLLLSPSLGYWRGQYQLEDASVSVGGDEVNSDILTVPRTKLLDASGYLKEERKKFAALDTERNKLVSRLTVKGQINGVRIAPMASVPEFISELIGRVNDVGEPIYDNSRELQSIGYRLGAAADEFVRNYDRIIEELAANTPARVWNSVKSKIPSRTQLRSFFYLRCPALRIAAPGQESLQMAAVDMADVDVFFRQAAARQVEDTITQIVVEPRAELCRALEDLRESINSNNRVTAKSFNPVRFAQQKLNLFEFGTLQDQPELKSKLEQLQNTMTNTVPSTLNQQVSASIGFDALLVDLIESLSNKAEEKKVSQNFYRRVRRVG